MYTIELYEEEVQANMKIALASQEFIDNNLEFNLNKLVSAMKEAKSKKTDLICFGEAYLQGFDAFSWEFENDKNIAISQNSLIMQQLQQYSREIEIDLFIGYLEIEDNILYSSYALVENGIITYNYRRISKGWKEFTKTDSHYQEGKSPILFNYKGKKCLAALCGDLWDFPEEFKLNQDILFWPVYVDFSIEDWEKSFIEEYKEQASKVGSDVYLINSICKPTGFGGCFHFKDNKIVKLLKPGNEGLLIVE